jgi:hypothetical protein
MASGAIFPCRQTDITYIAIRRPFVDLAAILDVWSRRVVRYACLTHQLINANSEDHFGHLSFVLGTAGTSSNAGFCVATCGNTRDNASADRRCQSRAGGGSIG